MKKALLISTPFAALERQALGLSLLKALLAREGLPCDVRYLTFAFAEVIGYGEYQWMTHSAPYTAFAGDWAFAEALYGQRPAADDGYEREVLRGAWRLDDGAVARIRRVRAQAALFVERCLATIPWGDYALVGFTSTFAQNIASLALARRIKQEHPQIAIVFGGANWEGEMGLELHRQFPFVDYACSGEAEGSFPTLARSVLAGRAPGPIPGVIARAAGGSVSHGPHELVRDLDALPVPDYADYFRDLRASTIAPAVASTLLIETSRGCWWGAKSHCTFCGLNGGSMAFRRKSAGRALAELEELSERWQIRGVEAVDNIIDMTYFRDMLPALEAAGAPYSLFYEVKANLRREHVRLLSAAGVRSIQPGIESLSDRVLTLMRKGSTALVNVQLLKWCREYGVRAVWNLLYGFPGERRDDYAASLALMRQIRFLNPPYSCGPVRLDRFSPYFEDPTAFGLRNVRPMAAYRYLYPFDDDALARIAYYFDYDYAPEVDPGDSAAEALALAQEWRRSPDPGTLVATPAADGALLLLDTRTDRCVDELALRGAERSIYEHCDSVRTPTSVARHLAAAHPDEGWGEADVRATLDRLVALGVMLSDGSHYLSLALGASPHDV
jgi:ribosomal peptide maturation radical SAM protein 1